MTNYKVLSASFSQYIVQVSKRQIVSTKMAINVSRRRMLIDLVELLRGEQEAPVLAKKDGQNEVCEFVEWREA